MTNVVYHVSNYYITAKHICPSHIQQYFPNFFKLILEFIYYLNH